MLHQDKVTRKAVKRVMWKLEERNVSWMKDLLRNLSGPEEVVIDFCGGTWSTAKVCMLLDEHRTFARCGVDSEMSTVAEVDVLLTFV